jgi:stress response protein YsnF
MKDQEIEMRATSEEPVIGKDARVTEELVVKKTADDRTENVQDTVRHTEVDLAQGQDPQSARQFQDDQSGRR